MSSPKRETVELEKLSVDDTSTRSLPTTSALEKDVEFTPSSLSDTGIPIPTKNHEVFSNRLVDEKDKKSVSESKTESTVSLTQSQSNASKKGSLNEQRMSAIMINNPLELISTDLDKEDDGFHVTPHTVIIPSAATAAATDSPRGTTGSVRHRFTVSPAQVIPGSVSSPGTPGSVGTSVHGSPSRRNWSVVRRHVHHSGGNVASPQPSHHSQPPSRQISTSTTYRSNQTSPAPGDHSPEVQFKLSDLSLPRVPETELEQPLLDNEVTLTNEKLDRVGTEPMMPTMADLEEMFVEVDENQKTVQSEAGISIHTVDTQDSLLFETAPFQCGNIKFVKDAFDSQGFQTKKHYVCIPPDTEADQVTQFMSKYWAMRNPKIVLSVISDIEHFKPWKSQRLKDDFEKGIIKAANTTNMWIITNGIDGGIAKLIGDAVKQEKLQQFNSEVMANPLLVGHELRRKRLTVIGIVPKDTVAYGVYFDGTDGVQIKNMGQKPGLEIYELNPDHTHFIMIEDEGKEASFTSMRFAIEKQLQIKYGPPKRIRLMSIGAMKQKKVAKDPGSFYLKKDETVAVENTIPVVGLLVQGSYRNIDHILYYLQNKMPIVVLKGSGGIADIITYAYEEIMERGEDNDYQENFLKPELIKYLMKSYGSKFEENDPMKFSLRDKIIECARLAAEAQSSGEGSNMTIVNIKGWGSSLKDLDKFILMALFKAGKHDGSREPLQSDLQLAVDWNRPDLAAEIFQQDFAKVRVDKSMFEQSLLKKDREDLIELFLSQGVRVHKFLNHKKLKLLFEKAEDREFFLNVCLEQVLGLFLFPDQELDSSFLSEHLNRLIYKLTGIKEFIQPYELSMNATGMYIIDPHVAERKAFNTLMIWAVLLNRHKLAKTLWTQCDEPICIALICSMVYRQLSKYNMEQFQKTVMEEQASEFGEMALGVLDICWQDSSNMAYNMLSRPHEDFNKKTVIEIAYNAGYIHFLAHPCCQKWLTKSFFGNLQVKELDWGLFRLPYWFKILTSVFLILPIYLWISFIPPKKRKAISDIGEEFDQDSEDDDDSLDGGEGGLRMTQSALDMTFQGVSNRCPLGYLFQKKDTIGKRILRTTLAFRREKKNPVPFWQKIYLLWTAPITKFWTSQTFYFIYLAVFCFATLWPTCGNIYIDMVLWLWTAVILLELVCRVYMKFHRYKTLSLIANCVEIILITLFLVALLMMRILQNWVALTNYIHSKTILCYGLIYFFYRLLGIYLLISPTLGPNLLRMKRMIKHDFVAFIRMFLIFMIAGGVTVQAILYPNFPLSGELFKRVITRPIYSMFLTPIQDLDGDPACSPAYENTTGYCASGRVDGSKLQQCPYSSFSGYVINLQYLFITKLVLITLLFAMFALTIAKVDKEASQIWKFQRYELIADLQNRFSLPPPFTIFSILYLMVKFVVKKIIHGVRRCFRLCSCCKKKKPKLGTAKSRIGHKATDDTCFWKQRAREYMAKSTAEKEKEQMPERHGDILISLTEDLKAHRKSMKRLADRVVELERMVQSSRLYLEDIAHKLDKSDVQGITDVKGQFIHVAARQSPYPGTSITRFPVFDKYVPWEISYDVYDPKVYSLPKDNFPENERFYVDVDFLEIQRKKEEREMKWDGSKGLPPLQEEEYEVPPLFMPKWNAVVALRWKGIRKEIDRRSWIDKDNQPLRYTLDPAGVPVNPMGRTGIRGKGVLWRWGPNHLIKAVITRWRRKYTADLELTSDFLYVEGKRVLEFITVPKTELSEGQSEVNYGLPGEVLHGDSNTYTTLCKAFMVYVLDQPDVEKNLRFDQADMIQYFAQFSSNLQFASSMTSLHHAEGTLSRSVSRTLHLKGVESTAGKHDMEQQGFSASLLYKGYLDDPRNTDNAWVEAEVWNFHYDLGDDIDMKLKPDSGVKWKEVSPYVKMFGNESVIVQEAAKIQDAYH